MAAVLHAPDGRVLLAERPLGRAWSGYWEFPGGKIEPGEHAPQALRRELHEELGIVVPRLRPLVRFRYRYPEREVELDFWQGPVGAGDPIAREAQRLDWVDPRRLPAWGLLPANRPLATLLALGRLVVLPGLAFPGRGRLSLPRAGPAGFPHTTVLLDAPRPLAGAKALALGRRIRRSQRRGVAVLLRLRRRAEVPLARALPVAGWVLPGRRPSICHGWLRAWGETVARDCDFILRERRPRGRERRPHGRAAPAPARRPARIDAEGRLTLL